jgi:hypothetical protein
VGNGLNDGLVDGDDDGDADGDALDGALDDALDDALGRSAFLHLFLHVAGQWNLIRLASGSSSGDTGKRLESTNFLHLVAGSIATYESHVFEDLPL